MLNLCYLTSTHRVMSTTWLSVQVDANNLKNILSVNKMFSIDVILKTGKYLFKIQPFRQ